MKRLSGEWHSWNKPVDWGSAIGSARRFTDPDQKYYSSGINSRSGIPVTVRRQVCVPKIGDSRIPADLLCWEPTIPKCVKSMQNGVAFFSSIWKLKNPTVFLHLVWIFRIEDWKQLQVGFAWILQFCQLSSPSHSAFSQPNIRRQ